MLGWEASHKEFCSQEVEEWKVKVTQQDRKVAGYDRLDEKFNKESFGKNVLSVKKLCKKAGSSKKAPTPAQDQNQGDAEVKEGNIAQSEFASFVL